MVESEIYEDADSKVLSPSKNPFSIYQDSKDKINNNFSKIKNNKENESSSIYQDAQSRVTNNSGQKNNNNYNQMPKKGRERNLIELKKEFLQKNNIFNDEKEEESNQKNKNNNNNVKEEIIYDNNDIYNNNNNSNDNNKDQESESEYYEPEASNIVKNPTIFEGATQKGGCCNLPKCFIF